MKERLRLLQRWPTCYLFTMSKYRQIAVRLDDNDQAALNHLQAKLGLRSSAEVLRMAIHEAARRRGYDDAPQATGTEG